MKACLCSSCLGQGYSSPLKNKETALAAVMQMKMALSKFAQWNFTLKKSVANH